MSLVHNGVTLFGDNTHSDVFEAPYDFPVQIGQWFGLQGESHLIGQTHGRELFCEVDATGYATPGAILTAMTALRNYINQPLHGDLVITFPSGGTNTEPSCTFTGLHKVQPGIRHNPVDSTYYTKLIMTWRQSQ